MSVEPLEVVIAHRHVARRSFFEHQLPAPIFFDTGIECCVVIDPRLCETLLRSARLRMSAYSAAYDDLERRTQDQFPNLQTAIRHIPLCQDGESHRRVRGRLA